MITHDGGKYTIYALEGSTGALDLLRQLNGYGPMLSGKLTHPLYVRICSSSEMNEAAGLFGRSDPILLVAPNRQVFGPGQLLDQLIVVGSAPARKVFGAGIGSIGGAMPPGPVGGSGMVGAEDLAQIAGAEKGDDNPYRQSVDAATFERPRTSADGPPSSGAAAAESQAFIGQSSDSPYGGGAPMAPPMSAGGGMKTRSSDARLAFLQEGTSPFSAAAQNLASMSVGESIEAYMTKVMPAPKPQRR